jgi:hypothetical protein
MRKKHSRTTAFAILLTAGLLAGGCQPYRTMSTKSFVGSSRTKMYYLEGCAAAKALPQSEKIFLQDEKTAISMGYKKATDPGCSTSK